MTSHWWESIIPEDTNPRDIDTSVPSVARIYDYWLGGKDNFAVDRKAAEQAIAAYPGIVRAVRIQRRFLARAVRHLASERNVRQFLDIGTGIPTASNTHEVAQSVAPESRVVYVDNDPMVLAHARALLTGVTGPTAYVDADLRDTAKILAEAGRLLDFSQPVAVLLIGILHFVPDTDDPYRIVQTLMAATAPGSYLVISHPASDIRAEQVASMAERLNRLQETKGTLRSYTEVARFFDGLELIPPGLVQAHQWRPGSAAADSGEQTPGYCGVARKP